MRTGRTNVSGRFYRFCRRPRRPNSNCRGFQPRDDSKRGVAVDGVPLLLRPRNSAAGVSIAKIQADSSSSGRFHQTHSFRRAADIREFFLKIFFLIGTCRRLKNYVNFLMTGF